MKENVKVAWIASWFALVGQLMIFMSIAIIANDWRYLMWSFIAAMMAGGAVYDSHMANPEESETGLKKDE